MKTFAISPESAYISYIDANASLHIVHLETNAMQVPGESAHYSSTSFNHVTGVANKHSCRSASANVSLSWHPDYPILAAPLGRGAVGIFAHPSLDISRGLQSAAKGYSQAAPAEFKEHYLVGDEDSGSSHGSVELNLVAFSPNGRYLASADIAGVVVLWDLNISANSIDAVQPLRKFQFGMSLFDLAWCQRVEDNYLIVSSVDKWCKVDDVVPLNSDQRLPLPVGDNIYPTDASPAAKDSLANASVARKDTNAATVIEAIKAPAEKQYSKLQKNSSSAAADVDDDDEDGLFDDEASVQGVSLEELKKQALEHSSKPRAQADVRVRMGDDLDDDEDDIISNVEELEAAALAKQMLNATNLVIDLQKPFQPAETRWDEKSRRYMVWNHVGSVTNYEEAGGNRIEVRFTNHESGKPEVFSDIVGYTRAALAFEGAFFASDAEEPEAPSAMDDPDVERPKGVGSEVYYRAFPGQKSLAGANESFTYRLTPGEQALVVAAGKGWMATATSKNLLRLFSSSGLQLGVFSLKGPVVTIVGCESHLAVFYHTGSPLNGQPRIAVDVLDIPHDQSAFSLIVNEVMIPLGRNARLVWAGFDRESMLLNILDSDDMLSSLVAAAGWQWVPVLDIASMKKTVDYMYWPVMVKNAQLVYVLLNGETRPSVFPPPIVSVVPFKIPVVMHKDLKDTFNRPQNQMAPQMVWDICKASHWDHLKNIAVSVGNVGLADDLALRLEQQEKEADKLILKMLQEACKYQMTGVAFDLVHRLRTDQALNIAIKVANNFGRTKVAEAIDAIVRQRQELAAAAIGVSVMDQYNDENDVPEIVSHSSKRGSADVNRLPPAVPTFSKPHFFKSAYDDETDGYTQSAPVVPVNPFATKASPSSQGQPKRKNALEGFQEMKGSPSPKKPALAVREQLFRYD